IKGRSINNVEVRPRPDTSSVKVPTGNTSFGPWLLALKPETGYSKHAGILIASDNDSEPAKSFKAIQHQIASAGGYGVPNAPREIVPKQNNLPAVAVLMLPGDKEQGCLETLCLRAALSKRRKISRCIAAYLQCVGTEDWTVSNLAKLRMRC